MPETLNHVAGHRNAAIFKLLRAFDHNLAPSGVTRILSQAP